MGGVARRACGGHGYGLFSGLPQLYLNCMRCLTVEGDNTVLCLQVARSLVGVCAGDNASTIVGDELAYLAANVHGEGQCPVHIADDWVRPETFLHALEFWAATVIRKAASSYHSDMHKGLSHDEAWEKNMVL